MKMCPIKAFMHIEVLLIARFGPNICYQQFKLLNFALLVSTVVL